MRRLEDLEVWRRAFAFTTSVYRFTEQYPRAELFRLTDQTCRAAVSVPANVGEGWGRGTPGEFRYFLRVAAGSATELETHLLLGVALGYATKGQLQPLMNELHRIRRMIDGLARTLIRSSRSARHRMPRADQPKTDGRIPNASPRPRRRG